MASVACKGLFTPKSQECRLCDKPKSAHQTNQRTDDPDDRCPPPCGNPKSDRAPYCYQCYKTFREKRENQLDHKADNQLNTRIKHMRRPQGLGAISR